MKWDLIDSLLRRTDMPVIICENSDNYPIAYMNMNAEIYFYPQRSWDNLTCPECMNLIDTVQPLMPRNDIRSIVDSINRTGRLKSKTCELIIDGLHKTPFSISGNLLSLEGDNDYVLLFFNDISRTSVDNLVAQFLELIGYVLYADDANVSIQSCLEMAGKITNVSRAYIFEDISPEITSNTYEWCAKGIKSQIKKLQQLNKNDYNYNVIVSAGVFVCNDISKLPSCDRVILEPQGIKSIAVIALYLHGRAIGYVGFDSCERLHTWGPDEIKFLQNISHVILSLIRRRDAERVSKRSTALLKLVCDSSDDLIHVKDINTDTVLMVNNALLARLSKAEKEIIGKQCGDVLLHKDYPGDFRPQENFNIIVENENSHICEWENYNADTKRHYKIKNCLVHWQNGQLIQVEIVTDMTKQKDDERKLKQIASTDTITGICNRTWGAIELRKKLDNKVPGYLSFIDVDGLKSVNDTLGHKVGDAMLTETVQIVNKHLTAEDFICRWGGDEFLIWLHGSEEYATQLMNNITEYIHRLNQQTDRVYTLSFSYGTIFFGDGQFDTLISSADNLMYQQKMKKRELLHSRRRDDTVDERLL